MKQWIFIALILCFVINGCDGYQANLGKLVRKWKVAEEIDECIPDDSDQCTVPGNWSSTRKFQSFNFRYSGGCFGILKSLTLLKMI